LNIKKKIRHTEKIPYQGGVTRTWGPVVQSQILQPTELARHIVPTVYKNLNVHQSSFYHFSLFYIIQTPYKPIIINKSCQVAHDTVSLVLEKKRNITDQPRVKPVKTHVVRLLTL
jgi:hypothetical protein